MLRSPLDELHSSHPDLATQLETLSSQLHSSSFDAQQSQADPLDATDVEQAGKQRRRLAGDYQNLLAQIRQLPGLKSFLQPTKAHELKHAAHNGPVVVVNCHSNRCDALFILPDQDEVDHLSLPDFTEEKAQQAHSNLETSLRQKGLRQRGIKVRHESGYEDYIGGVLQTLWCNIVHPVLSYLGYMDKVPLAGEQVPHITWCPTGSLSFLPLHAAGDYSQPRSRVFDYVVSSYTPTLTALLARTPRSLTQVCRVLAIGQASTPGRSSLPGTARELACVKAQTDTRMEYSQLTNDQATTTVVLDAMEQHDWVHLACHAHQNVNDATKSGFFLHDGTLDLSAINQRSFKNKGLAFLSACETATGDDKLPDEAIHLASGMLMAGYPSVIATMWSVVDEDAPFVADKVYAQLMKDMKVGNGEAGRALHYAVAGLREKVGEKEFGRIFFPGLTLALGFQSIWREIRSTLDSVPLSKFGLGLPTKHMAVPSVGPSVTLESLQVLERLGGSAGYLEHLQNGPSVSGRELSKSINTTEWAATLCEVKLGTNPIWAWAGVHTLDGHRARPEGWGWTEAKSFCGVFFCSDWDELTHALVKFQAMAGEFGGKEVRDILLA
ncbi:unnamed protein product [Rhizoctonia solani]|nr:unnamed protein product [Rhizoctonia solani]